MKKNKLLIVSGRLGKGGAERFVSNLISFLDRERFDIHLCLGSDCIEYPLPSDIKNSNLDNKTFFHQPRTINRLKCIIENEKPDTILSVIGLANRWTGAALGLLTTSSPRWIARIGNNPKHGGRSQWRNSLNLKWDKFTYKTTDHFVVNSFGLKKSFQDVFPHTAKNISVHYNPTNFEQIADLAQLKPIIYKEKGTTVLVHAGRFHRQKRHDLLLESFALLRKRKSQGENIELWLCGEGYLQSKIEEQIKKLQIQESVKLLGHQKNPYPIFKQADLFVLASDWEGMPNVLIEAMGLAVPVLSTDCPCGPAELIDDGVSGFLSPPGNIDVYTDNIERALRTSSTELISIAETGQRHVIEQFDYRFNMQLWQDTLNNRTI